MQRVPCAEYRYFRRLPQELAANDATRISARTRLSADAAPSDRKSLSSARNTVSSKTPASERMVEAADKALYSAKTSGRARARMLDIADVDIPWLVKDVANAPRHATR